MALEGATDPAASLETGLVSFSLTVLHFSSLMMAESKSMVRADSAVR